MNHAGLTNAYCSCQDSAGAVMDSIAVAMGRSVECPNCILGSTNAFRSEVTLEQARCRARGDEIETADALNYVTCGWA